MIPPFSESGYLPPGIHPATLDEIDARFGQVSELRARADGFGAVDGRIGGVPAPERIVLNGSFVTDIMEPNDVDCVLLFQRGSRRDRAAFKELRAGLPFLDIAIVGPKRFDQYVNRLFAADRYDASKGMIEVLT